MKQKSGKTAFDAINPLAMGFTGESGCPAEEQRMKKERKRPLPYAGSIRFHKSLTAG
ncbi:MAG TPA: hypothetical protein H9668_06600 [Firmicutes bacterium]|nr:hypothetical protein [Bacillota bacterium]